MNMMAHRQRLSAVNRPTLTRASRYSGVMLPPFVATLLLMSSCGKASGPFTAEVIQEYVAMATAAEEATQEPYILGKAVVINAGASLSHSHRTAFTQDPVFRIEPQTLSDIHETINEPIRAASPSEVGTVVLLRWEKNVLRRNVAGVEFVQVRCHVIVLDATTRRIVGQESFAGGIPAGTHRWGSSPEDTIIAYINRLPRRARPTGGGSGEGAASRPTREYLDTTNGGLSFQYPVGWEKMGPSEARRLMGEATPQYLSVVIYDPVDRTQNVNVQVLPTAVNELTEASYVELAEQIDRSGPGDFPGFRKVSSHVGTLRDMVSLEYVFDATRPDGIRLRQKQLRTGKGNREVVITFSARADIYDQADEACFRLIRRTLKLQ